MKKTIGLSIFIVPFVLIFLLNFPLPLNSQCNPYVIEVGKKVNITFRNAVRIAIVDSEKLDDRMSQAIDIPPDNLTAKQWLVLQPNVDRIKQIVDQLKKNNIKRKKIKALWMNSNNDILGGPKGLKAFKLDGETEEEVCEEIPVEPGESEVGGNTSCDSEQIGMAWNKWLVDIETDMRTKSKYKENYVAILFDQNLGVIKVSRDYGVVGDWIYVGVLRKGTDPVGKVSVEFTPCDTESEAPNVYVGGPFDSSKLQAAEDICVIDQFFPGHCYNSEVTIKVEKKGLSDVKREPVTMKGQYIWHQYQRLRAALQLGILFTDLQEQTYGIRQEGDTTVIYSKGPEDKGPSYVTSLVIYSFPRYLTSIFSSKSRFQGRDILHDNDFIDRINAVLSVGINNPGRRFSFGLSFEVVYGINIVGVYEYARITELAGLKVGDEFTGAADTIPTHDVWKKKLTFGLSIDLRYVTALFSKR